MTTEKPIPVLVAEDSKITQVFLGVWLPRQNGFVVTEAQTIADARAILTSGYRPEVIMLDLQFPDGDGEDLFQTILDLGEPRPRTVIVSATTDSDRLARALSHGPQPITVLSKPWSAETMLAALSGKPCEPNEKE